MADEDRGKLKIFLGYAAGVGKTYQMLEEAQAAKRQGIDVVIGYFEPHGRKDTIAQTEGLETIPRRKIDYRGALFEEMDTDAILLRHPEICVVDEFPHTNVPGSERLKRWQDVQVLLDAGINVLTTMNIQHLESLNDQIWQITGIRVRETIPDWVMQQADQVVMVDLTPRALLNRLARGVVYSQEKAQKALAQYPRGDLKYQMDSGSEFAEKVALDFSDMHLLQDLISGIRTRRKEGGIDEKATTDIEVDALGTGRRVVEENQVIIQRLAKVGYLQQVNRFSDGLLMYSNPSFDLGIRYERTIDVAAESERLTKDIAKYEKGLASAERQLGNEGFLAKAPAHIVEGLKKQESETRLLLEKARAALNALPPA